jgi:ankyrin repeat protein
MLFPLPVDLQNNPFITCFEQHYSKSPWSMITYFIESNRPLKAALASKRRERLPGSLCYAGQQTLLLAVIENQPILVQHLVNVGVYVDLEYATHETPLIIAAMRGHDEVVRVLCDMGANINARDGQGFTALMRAAANGYAQVVTVLLDVGANPFCVTENGYTALMLAATRQHADAFQSLWSCANPCDKRVNHVGVITLLGPKGNKDVLNVQQETALMQAVKHQQMDTADALLCMGVFSVRYSNGDTLFMRLIRLQVSRSVFDDFLNRSVGQRELTPTGETMLMFAMRQHCQHAIDALLNLKEGINLEAINRYGRTALMLASQLGQFRVCKLLVARGARANVTDAKGKLPHMLYNRASIRAYLFDVYQSELSSTSQVEEKKAELTLTVSLKRPLEACSMFVPEAVRRVRPICGEAELGVPLSHGISQGEEDDMRSNDWSQYTLDV